MKEFDEIFETFEVLGDWETRYAYLVELGERLSAMPEGFKSEENRVKPCMSTVYVQAVKHPQNADKITYLGDCDTAIIKGVLALLVEVMSGKSAREILDMDIDALFEGLKLHEHLSPTRHVGIFAIVEHMKQQASRFIADAA